MTPSPPGIRRLVPAAALLLLAALSPAGAADEEWTSLQDLSSWRPPTGDWKAVGDVGPNPDNPRRLVATKQGDRILFNGPGGRTRNLVSKATFGDVEVHLEFLVPKGSNSGIKLEGLYEIQIFDSWGVKRPRASDCGGIYPRAELLPKYHYLDEGYPPRVNACRPPGEWQSLDITFQAPRFDAGGKKIASARFVKVVLNGQVVQEDVEVPTPTGHAWHDQEKPTGPILLQADHGPVAFRDVRARPWRPTAAPKG
jgi:hypothetical protein